MAVDSDVMTVTVTSCGQTPYNTIVVHEAKVYRDLDQCHMSNIKITEHIIVLYLFLCHRPERSAGGIYLLDHPSVHPSVCP